MTANYQPPPGFVFDPNSGMYYQSVAGNDPATGQVGNWVTWFNAGTGEYTQQFYPAAPVTPVQQEVVVQQPVVQRHSVQQQSVAQQHSAVQQQTTPPFGHPSREGNYVSSNDIAKKKFNPILIVLPLVGLLVGIGVAYFLHGMGEKDGEGGVAGGGSFGFSVGGGENHGGNGSGTTDPLLGQTGGDSTTSDIPPPPPQGGGTGNQQALLPPADYPHPIIMSASAVIRNADDGRHDYYVEFSITFQNNSPYVLRDVTGMLYALDSDYNIDSVRGEFSDELEDYLNRVQPGETITYTNTLNLYSGSSTMGYFDDNNIRIGILYYRCESHEYHSVTGDFSGHEDLSEVYLIPLVISDQR